MKKRFIYYLGLLFLFSCTVKKKVVALHEPGVVITFDDDFIQEWYETDSIMSQYQWKATFCVTYIDSLSKKEIKQLKDLQDKGNEIAGHGYSHENAREYAAKKGVKKYVTDEILPMIKAFQREGLNLHSFAYPFGANSPSLDRNLSKYFKVLRRTYGADKKLKDNSCFFSGKSQLVTGLGIDYSYQHFDIDFFIKLLKYAKKNNKIIILYAHKPVKEITSVYQVDYKTLHTICQFVKNNNMRFYRLSELYSMIKKKNG